MIDPLLNCVLPWSHTQTLGIILMRTEIWGCKGRHRGMTVKARLR
jgi:hypothetical protein